MDLDAIEAACERSVHDGMCVSGNVVQCMTAIPDLIARIREQDAEIKRLRALCGQAAFEQDIAERAGYGALSRGTHDRLRAASKGEQ